MIRIAFRLIWLCSAYSLDPEVSRNTLEIIRRWGYPAESVKVTTEDGYILELHHIMGGKNGSGQNTRRPVVFMQHGLIAASEVWVSNLPNQSAGFLFADAGFDVWLANSRGNTYGKEHVALTAREERFWEFSWDEMAKYDLPTSIGAVLELTGQNSLYYVGHSQGTTILFARNSEDETLTAKVRKHFALCPVATFAHIRGLFALLAQSYPLLLASDELFGSHEFLPSNLLMKLVAAFVCPLPLLGDLVCSGLFFSIAGPNTKQLNATRNPVYLSHLPAGTSTQNMLHWFQMTRSGKTQKFDFESEKENADHYGERTAPLYNLSRVNIDTYLYWGDVDWLATPDDIKEGLLPYLNPAILKESNFLKSFNHMDFLWGLRAADEVYRPIIEVIREDWNSWGYRKTSFLCLFRQGSLKRANSRLQSHCG